MNSELNNHIIDHLKTTLVAYNNIVSFSNNSGIYAIGFAGDVFPLKSARKNVRSGDVIYIGKTEDSQSSRDKKTHFQSGKSGSSTVRRTLGALLREQLKLEPIPRSDTEKSDKRFVNYAFTPEGEERLTTWMETNLSLSFWEYDGSVSGLRKIETEIILSVRPILNLTKNKLNSFKGEIISLRKTCANIARNKWLLSYETEA